MYHTHKNLFCLFWCFEIRVQCQETLESAGRRTIRIVRLVYFTTCAWDNIYTFNPICAFTTPRILFTRVGARFPRTAGTARNSRIIRQHNTSQHFRLGEVFFKKSIRKYCIYLYTLLSSSYFGRRVGRLQS